MRLRAVSLDAAGTLFEERRGRAALYAEALARHGARHPVEDVDRWMQRAHLQLTPDVAGAPRYSDGWFVRFVGDVLAAAGCDAPPDVVRAELVETFTDPAEYTVFADVPPALARLSDAGLRLALVSNWSARLPRLLEQLDLARWFDAVLVSEIEGYDKPDRRLFLAAVQRLDVPPGACLHVGDHPVKDVEGARAAGLQAWLLDRDGRGDPRPDTVPDLLAVVERLAR